jgi:hypothetical protein
MPSSRFCSSEAGSGVTKNIEMLRSTVIAVCTPSHRLRRPVRSALEPVTGASSAISTPAPASPHPSHAEWSASVASSSAVAGPSPPVSASAAATVAGSTNASDVIHRVNTNVVMTAWNAADPQSHSAQASTRRRGTGTGAVARGVSCEVSATRAA